MSWTRRSELAGVPRERCTEYWDYHSGGGHFVDGYKLLDTLLASGLSAPVAAAEAAYRATVAALHAPIAPRNRAAMS